MALIFLPEVPTYLLAPILPYKIWHMLDGIGVKYGIFGIFDINDTFGTWHLKCLDMAIWVSKDASGPQECRPMRLNKFWIGLMAQNYKILTFTFFLCIFRNFLCIFKMLWAKWRSNPRNFCWCFWTQWDHRTYI